MGKDPEWLKTDNHLCGILWVVCDLLEWNSPTKLAECFRGTNVYVIVCHHNFVSFVRMTNRTLLNPLQHIWTSMLWGCITTVLGAGGADTVRRQEGREGFTTLLRAPEDIARGRPSSLSQYADLCVGRTFNDLRQVSAYNSLCWCFSCIESMQTDINSQMESITCKQKYYTIIVSRFKCKPMELNVCY